jgi:ABC-2 type transport system permease protein
MDRVVVDHETEYINKVRNRTFVKPVNFIGVILLMGWLTSINSDVKSELVDDTSENYAQLFLKTPQILRVPKYSKFNLVSKN